MQQVKWRRDKKAMEERLSRLEEKMRGEERKKVESMEFGDWSEWEEDWKSVDLSEEEDKVARGRKRVRSEVSRASEGTKRSKSGERRRHSGRQNEHRSSGKRMEVGGDMIERHINKVIMIRKGRNWEEEYGVADWIQTELGELDTQITKTNDRQVYKIWCAGKGTRERIWEAKRKWEEEAVATLEE